MLLSDNESKAICETLLSCTGADDAEASVTSEDFSHLRFAANSFTTSGRRENASAGITVWIDKKRGSASANDLDDASLKRAAEEAEQLARISPVDREYVPTLGPQSYRPSNGYVEATVNISLSERAREVDAVIRACQKAGVIGAGFHHSHATTTTSATKNGNFRYRRSSLVSLSVTARTPDGSS